MGQQGLELPEEVFLGQLFVRLHTDQAEQQLEDFQALQLLADNLPLAVGRARQELAAQRTKSATSAGDQLA